MQRVNSIAGDLDKWLGIIITVVGSGWATATLLIALKVKNAVLEMQLTFARDMEGVRTVLAVQVSKLDTVKASVEKHEQLLEHNSTLLNAASTRLIRVEDRIGFSSGAGRR